MSTNSFLLSSDLSDLCRVCLQLPEESQYLDLTTIYDEEDSLTYAECFTICTQIDLNDGEGLPHHLCKSCGLELQMSYDFYKKVEESKRVIEQRLEAQKQCATEFSDDSEQCKNQNSNEKSTRLKLIGKYTLTDDEEQLPGPSEEAECEQQYLAPIDEPKVVNNIICDTECDAVHQVSADKISSNLDALTENNVTIDVVDHLEMEDYQNLEALEEEETETIQLKYGENTIPICVTKYKAVQNGADQQFLEYSEDYDEEEQKEETREDLGKQHTQERNEENKDHVRWQENVVTVANKKHIPIEFRDKEEDRLEIVISESAEDEPNEGAEEDENNEEVYTPTDQRNSNNTNNYKNNNSTVRKRHVGSYSCDYCHRVYPNYSRMKTHRRCHEIDRPKFSCSHCGRMYATKQARDCHIQTAHDKSGYSCSICNKVFAIRKSLEIHVRYHTGDFPYACKLCDRKFAQACHLNTHVNVKHNKIRFSCEYPNCGKFFTSSSSLRNHEYTHGIMPFECEYCQQGYPAKSKLRIHIQRKHCINMSNEQLEKMRKFHVMRSKVNLVQFLDT